MGNIDRLEKLLSIERINRIAVQLRMFGPEPEKLAVPISRNETRSAEPMVEGLPVYNSGEKVSPPARTVQKLTILVSLENVLLKILFEYSTE